MASTRETILTALLARLSALPATTLRGEVLPERIPAAGLLILRDGEPGEPEVTLSPLRYHYRHRVEIEAVVQGSDRDTAFDTLCTRISAALDLVHSGLDVTGVSRGHGLESNGVGATNLHIANLQTKHAKSFINFLLKKRQEKVRKKQKNLLFRIFLSRQHLELT